MESELPALKMAVGKDKRSQTCLSADLGIALPSNHSDDDRFVQSPCPDRGLLFMVLVAFLPFGGLIAVHKLEFETSVGILEHVSQNQYPSVITLFFTLTCTIVGLGLETLVGLQIVRSVKLTKTLVTSWKLAQLLLPLLITVAVFCKTPFGLVALSLGLWKLGLPEVVGSMLAAIMLIDLPLSQRTSHFLNSVFVLLHHVSATYVVCGIISKEFPLSREIVSVVIPLVLQHWTPILQYNSAHLFIFLVISFEIWFEIEVFRNVNSVPPGPRVAALLMVCAHWGLLLAGTISTLFGMTSNDSLHHQSLLLPAIWKQSMSRYEHNRRRAMNAKLTCARTTWPRQAATGDGRRIHWGGVVGIKSENSLRK